MPETPSPDPPPLPSLGGWSSPGEQDPPSDGAEHPFDLPEPGRYEVGGTIGLGGMGRVLLARDLRLDRDVAFKVLRPGIDDALALRLAREARVTARLEHPGIVPVYDAGRSPDGRLFYVMRLVRGRSLHEAIRAADGLDSRLLLLRHFLGACEAVAYAHDRGVLHRDLKPGNVMLGRFGETQVVDWGLAWVDGEDPPAGAAGTPAYMAPEQGRGEPATAASDVYSLGASLHELVVGATPAEGEPTDPGLVPPELAAIVSRAVASAPAMRYSDAGALAAAVARYLDGRRVTAHAYTPRELLVRFVAAWRVPLGVAAVALSVIAIGTAFSMHQIRGSRDRAVAAEAEAVGALAAADASLARLLTDRAVEALDKGFRAEAELLAAKALELDPESPRAVGVLAAWSGSPRPEIGRRDPLPTCRERTVSDDGRHILCFGSKGVSLWRAGASEALWSSPAGGEMGAFGGGGVVVVGGERRPLTALRLTDGAGAGGAGTIDLREVVAAGDWAVAHNGLELEALSLTSDVRVRRTACEGRGPERADPGIRTTALTEHGRLAVVCRDGWVELGPVDGSPDGGFVTPFGAERSSARSAAFSADGLRLAVTGHRGGVGVFEVEDGGVVALVERPVPLLEPRFASDGRTLVVVDEAGRVGLLAVESGEWLGALPPRPGRVARAAAGGLVTFDDERAEWALPRSPVPHVLTSTHGLTSATFSPSGDRVATTRGDGTLDVRRVVEGLSVAERRWQSNVVKPGGWSRDGSLFAAAGVEDPALRVWETERWSEVAAHRLSPHSWRRAAFLGDSVLALSFHAGVGAALLDPITGQPKASHPGRLWFDLGVDHGHDAAVLLADDGMVARLDGEGAATVLGTFPGAHAVDLYGDHVVVAQAHALHLRGAEEGTIESPDRTILDVAFSPDGALIATAELEGGVRLRGRGGAVRAELPGHRERVVGVEFSADGRRLVTAGWDGTARLWSTEPAPERRALEVAWGALVVDIIGVAP